MFKPLYFLKLYFYHKKKVALCQRLKRIRKNDQLINEDDFKNIKDIAEKAYPYKLNLYRDIEHLDEFLISYNCFCPEQVFCIVKPEWYFLAIKTLDGITIKDFASIGGKCREFMSVITYLYKLSDLFTGDKFYTLSRESTSYPLLLLAEKRKKIKIISDKCIAINSEYFHELIFERV